MAAVEGHEFGVAVDTAPELVIPNVPIEKFQLELELPLEEFCKVMPIGLMPLAVPRLGVAEPLLSSTSVM